MSTANKAVWVIIAILFLFSAFFVAHHFHDDFKTRVDCALCQSAQALSSGTKQDILLLVPPQLLELFFVLETSISHDFAFVFSIIIPRAPPV